MAAQQGPRQEGSKVDKDLPEERSRLLQSVLQTLRDAESAKEIKLTHTKKSSQSIFLHSCEMQRDFYRGEQQW